MSRATFPDAPLSRQELRDSLRHGTTSPPRRRYLFEEVREITKTITYVVLAGDEAEAHRMMLDGDYIDSSETTEGDYPCATPALIGEAS